MPRRYDPDDWWYEPSRPLPAKDGIRARSQGRTGFGRSWWARRWIEALERLGLGSRLQRGRSYARSGQVLSIDLQPGQVRARVQGSRPRPYGVSISIPPLSDPQWERVIVAIGQQAIFSARLLAGEMPQDIEQSFTAAGVPLFPASSRDLVTECSCPDEANPCKHIAAVYYLLGERFDEDPFLIFQLRGRSREQLMQALRLLRAAAVAEAPGGYAPVEAAPPLEAALAHFYEAGGELGTIALQIAAPTVEATSLLRLGPAPAGLDEELRAIYRALTAYALERAFGEA